MARERGCHAPIGSNRMVGPRLLACLVMRQRITSIEREFAAAPLAAVAWPVGSGSLSPGRLGHSDPVHAARSEWAAQRAAPEQAARHNAENHHSPTLTGNERERRDAWETHDRGRTLTQPGFDVGR